jgi:uncharacterized protein (DUF983 family)
MSPTSRPPLGLLLKRAALKRCPICGHRPIFDSFFRIKPACPQCGYVFERQPGYWVGAATVNIAVAEAWFFILFVAVLLSTLPEVPWQPLVIVALLTNGVLPALFYPHSKTFWMAIDLYLHPLKEGDPDDARNRTTAGAR